VQQLYDFPDQSSLKLTIGQYLTPGDESIQSIGITPDVQITPILAQDADNLNILPDEHTREEDLDPLHTHNFSISDAEAAIRTLSGEIKSELALGITVSA